MDRYNKWSLLTWLAITMAMLLFLTTKVMNNSLKFDADIFNVLDMGDEFSLLNKDAGKPFENKAMLLIQHKDSDVSKIFMRDLESNLVANEGVKNLVFNPNQQFNTSELTSIYGNFPLAFLSEKAQLARDSDNYDYLAERYIYQLSQPTNPLVSASINDAPLLNLADWFSDRLKLSNWRQDSEFLYATYQGNKYYPVFIEFGDDSLALNKVAETVYSFNESIRNSRYSDEVTVIKSGLIFHSAAVTSQARFETQLFGGLSLIGVLLLTLISFRNIKPLLSISLIIVSAVLSGMVALVVIFSKIHLLALVFAISLIGIAVDYGYHILLTAKYTGRTGTTLAKYIAPALLMGGGTTLVSYLLLLTLPIPLLHQVAVFVGAGIIFAVFTGLTIVAFWPGQPVQNNPVAGVTIKPIYGFYLLIGGLIVVSVIAISNWKFNDDINIFNSTPAHLVQNEILVNKVVGNQQYPRFIYVQADSEEQMLQRFELTRKAINQLNGAQFELRGIDTWVPSISTQRGNAEWLVRGITSQKLSLITSFMSTEPIDSMLSKAEQFLTIEQLPEPIQQLYPAFIQRNGKLIGILSYMGPLDESLLDEVEGYLDFSIQYIDQPTQLSAALTQLRTYISYFLSLAALALCILTAIRYGFKNGLILALVPIIIAFSALAVTQLIFGYVTIFNMLGCILIMALSIDYVIFLKEHGRMAHVLKAVTLSAATSGLAFGIMVFSETPAILHFGVTILFGVCFAWIVCQMIPLSLLGYKNISARE